MPPAARVGDPTNHPGSIVGPGVPTVMIGGKPAARVGDKTGCGAAIIPPGEPTVMIGG